MECTPCTPPVNSVLIPWNVSQQKTFARFRVNQKSRNTFRDPRAYQQCNITLYTIITLIFLVFCSRSGQPKVKKTNVNTRYSFIYFFQLSLERKKKTTQVRVARARCKRIGEVISVRSRVPAMRLRSRHLSDRPNDSVGTVGSRSGGGAGKSCLRADLFATLVCGGVLISPAPLRPVYCRVIV